MNGKWEPFWEEAYGNEEKTAFSAEPNETLVEFEHLLNQDFKILEVGCGEGQNLLYLARRGFKHLEAFDISEKGIGKLKRRCEVEGANIDAYVADLTKFQFEKSYDLIMSFGTLHFVSREEWRKFLRDAKNCTNVGGIHIMQIFTDQVPITEDLAPFAIGIAKNQEIKELYKGWEVLSFKSYIFKDEHSGMPEHFHAANKIVARRKEKF